MKSLSNCFKNLDTGYKNTLVLVLGSSFDKFAAFVTLPFLTRSLSIEAYGKLELLLVTYILYRVLSSLNLIQSVARFSGEYRNADKENVFFSTVSTIVFGNSLVLALLLYGSSHILALDFINLELAVIWLLANSFRDFGTAYLKFTGRVIFSIIESVTYSSLLTISTIILHKYDQLNISSFILTKCTLSAASVVTIAIRSRIRPNQFRFRSSVVKTALRYSIPYAVSSFCLIGFQYIDRFMISSMLSIGDVGVYGLAVKIASVFAIFSTSISTSIGPIIYASHEDSDTPDRIRRYFLTYNATGLIVGITLIALTEALFRFEIVNTDYSTAQQYIPILALIQIFTGYNIFFPGLNIHSRTTTLMLINLGGLIGIVILNLILIPAFGVHGALYSTLVSLTTTQLIIYKQAQKHYPLQLPIIQSVGGIAALFILIDWIHN